MVTCNWHTRTLTLLAALTLLLSLPGAAWSQERAPDMLGSRVNGLMTFDFANQYITPRGLHVEDQGLIGQPLLLLFWKLRSSAQGPLTDITLSTGLWNSFHSHMSGVKPSRWNEIDPILGATFKFRDGIVVDASTTAFYTPTDSYKTSGHADVKVTYNDSFAHGFSVNPFVDYWVELNDKATVVFNPATSKQGSYMTLGATPTIALHAAGATLEVAAFANIVSGNFYQRFDGTDGGSGLAMMTLAPKVSLPLKFLGIGFGAWTGYFGVSYYHLRNDGLLDGNEALDGTSIRKPNLSRIHGGLSVFF